MPLEQRNYISVTMTERDVINLKRRRVAVDTDTGEEIGSTNQRMTVRPGDDIAALPKRVRRICLALFTPELIEVYRTLRVLENVKADPDSTQTEIDTARSDFQAAKAAYETEIGEPTPIEEPTDGGTP